MLRALNLLLSPEAEWQKLALKPPHLLWILIVSLMPLIALTLAVEGWALVRFGEVFGEIGRRPVSIERAVKYTAFYALASLLIIFIGAKLLQNVGQSFNLNAGYPVCFVLIAFGYSPIFLARLLDALPGINTWICWAVGVALSMRVLYHGVAWWLKPEQTKGFGLFILNFLYILVLSGLVHFASIQVLQGRFLKQVMEKPAAALDVPIFWLPAAGPQQCFYCFESGFFSAPPLRQQAG